MQGIIYYRSLQLAFPNLDNTPPLVGKKLVIMLVPLNISGNLFFPEFSVIFRPDKISAPLMAMPKTTVYENNSIVLWEDDVRLSRKPGIVLSVTESLRKKIFSDQFFRFRVFPMNSGHIIAALLRCMHICHDNLSQVNPNNTLLIFAGRFW